MVVVELFIQTPFSKGRIWLCWSTFALQYSTATKILASRLTIRGKTKNFILFCCKVRGRDRTGQFSWFHIIVPRLSSWETLPFWRKNDRRRLFCHNWPTAKENRLNHFHQKKYSIQHSESQVLLFDWQSLYIEK